MFSDKLADMLLHFADAKILKTRTQKKLAWFILFILNLGVILSIWWSGTSNYYITDPSGGNIYVAIGRLFGLLMQFALIIQVLLISRITSIEQTFGFDKLNRLHRLIGQWIVVLLALHPLFLTLGYKTMNSYTLWQQFIDFLTAWKDVFLAFIGACLFICIIAISYAIIRKRLRYEYWYFPHLFTYLALFLVFFHQTNSGDLAKGWALYYWYTVSCGVFAFAILYRFIRPLWNAYRFRFRVERVAIEAKDTFSVYITGKQLERFAYKAGQYANITFLQKGLWFTHPFSFSMEHNKTHIRFTMKALGDHTKRLDELRPGTRVILDGPLGLFIEETSRNEKLLFIAGGIGITPIRSIIGDSSGRRRDMVLLYAVRCLDDIAFRSEFEELQKLHPFPVHYIISTPTSEYESGYLDREKLTRLVPDFLERDVYLCGPPPMMDTTIASLRGLGLKNLNLHYEKFSF